MTDRMNLLFIMTDQQRADTMACYGNDWIQTPTLNALAEDSFIFDNAYCAQPVCTPSRSTIMSGLFPHATGAIHNQLPIDSGVRTIAELLPGEYHTANIGKWHLGDEMVKQHGFDEWVSLCDSPFYCSKPEYQLLYSDYYHFLVEKGYTPGAKNARTGMPRFGKVPVARMPAPHTQAEFITGKTVEFLRARKDDGRPFAAYASLWEPHNPFTSRLDDLYDPQALPVDSQFLVPPTGVSNRTQLMADKWDPKHGEPRMLNQAGADLTTEAGWRQVRARYFGLATLVDRALASVFDALRETGLDRNTIVVFTSDHGDMMGDHRMLTKGVLYEQAIRVPLLMRVPALSDRHRRIAGRVGHVDLVPTLLDLLGVPAPQTLHGKSLRSVLESQRSLEDNDVFIEWETPDDNPTHGIPGRWRTIISDDWKLNVTTNDRAELYDLAADPQESTNLMDDAAAEPHVERLMRRLQRWQILTGDTLPLRALK